ncbi:Gamma-glutamyltransferase [Altererythrobacter insulae]|nr:Gamma-glutamyltransferase [Altererythrobacter insulae]
MGLIKLSPLVALPFLAACAGAYSSPLERTFKPSEPILAGAVSAADPRAQAAGEAILAKGGSATDAAIAVMLALTVVEPQSSGIGGGGFLVRGTVDGELETFDGRETAPAAATPDWFMGEDGKPLGYREVVLTGLSVGVPGNIRLAELAHAKHGSLPWAALFEPAIALARDGFAINNRLAGYLEGIPNRAGASAQARALYYDADGAPLPAGTVVTNEPLAQTLEALANVGPGAMYSGAIAAEIAQTVGQATPRDGKMTLADVEGYTAKSRDGICGQYRGYKVCSMGPPTSGGIAVLQMLGQLERFDLAAYGKDSPVTWHLFLESQRLAYADRELYLADSDFIGVPVAGLIDRQYLNSRSALINPDKRNNDVAAGKPEGADLSLADGNEPLEYGTSHFSVVDSVQTMVSYTSTIEGPFGSGLMVRGFYLNNELTDFSAAPEVDGKPVANRVEGGKRPRSSMSPVVVWAPDGEPFMAVGAAGGATIPVTTARAIIGAIDFGLGAHEALALPFIMERGGTVQVEEGTWLEGAIKRFESLGHSNITARPAGIKGNAILRENGRWVAASDPRIASGLEIP